MKKTYLLVLITLMAITGCKKLENTVETEVPVPLNFKLNSSTGDNVKSAYITQVVDVVPAKETGSNQAWVCNFGDGSPDIKGTTIMQIPHMYVKGGVYKVSFTTDGKTNTQTIRIYPGLRSYQIKNSASKELDLKTVIGTNQLDNRTFGIIKKDAITDTIYVSALDNSAVAMKLLGTYTDKHNETHTWWVDPDPQLKQYQHTVIELTNSQNIAYRFYLYNYNQLIETTLGKLLVE